MCTRAALHRLVLCAATFSVCCTDQLALQLSKSVLHCLAVCRGRWFLRPARRRHHRCCNRACPGQRRPRLCIHHRCGSGQRAAGSSWRCLQEGHTNAAVGAVWRWRLAPWMGHSPTDSPPAIGPHRASLLLILHCHSWNRSHMRPADAKQRSHVLVITHEAGCTNLLLHAAVHCCRAALRWAAIYSCRQLLPPAAGATTATASWALEAAARPTSLCRYPAT